MHWWTRITEDDKGRVTWAIGLADGRVLATGKSKRFDLARRAVDGLKCSLRLRPGEPYDAVRE